MVSIQWRQSLSNNAVEKCEKTRKKKHFHHKFHFETKQINPNGIISSISAAIVLGMPSVCSNTMVECHQSHTISRCHVSHPFLIYFERRLPINSQKKYFFFGKLRFLMGDENAEGKKSKIFSANTFESMWISRNWMSMLTNIFNVFVCRASKSAVRFWFRCSFCSVTLIDATRCLSYSQLTDGFTVEHEQIFCK